MVQSQPRAALTEAEMVVHVVPMRRRHLRGVLAIEAQVCPRPWTYGLFVSELAIRATRAYYVARVSGRLVGYVGLMMNLDEGHVTTLAVDPAWHRRGIGTRLLLVAAREALSRGASGLTLEVRVSNQPAIELYRRFGFRPVGIRRNYYVESNEDALVMWADDVQEADYATRLEAIGSGLEASTVVDEARMIRDRG